MTPIDMFSVGSRETGEKIADFSHLAHVPAANVMVEEQWACFMFALT